MKKKTVASQLWLLYFKMSVLLKSYSFTIQYFTPYFNLPHNTSPYFVSVGNTLTDIYPSVSLFAHCRAHRSAHCSATVLQPCALALSSCGYCVTNVTLHCALTDKQTDCKKVTSSWHENFYFSYIYTIPGCVHLTSAITSFLEPAAHFPSGQSDRLAVNGGMMSCLTDACMYQLFVCMNKGTNSMVYICI